jgi:hypothetical protein
MPKGSFEGTGPPVAQGERYRGQLGLTKQQRAESVPAGPARNLPVEADLFQINDRGCVSAPS